MGKINTLINNFTSGELSPRLSARADLRQYKNGVAHILNMTLMPQGGATSRLGFQSVATAVDSTTAKRLLPFVFSTDQSYIVEAGNLYMNFYKDRAPLVATGQAITGITKANPAVVTYSGADTYSNGDVVFISGVYGMTQVNNQYFVVANVNAGANTFQLSGVDSTTFDTYAFGGSVQEAIAIASPYTTALLPSLQTAQSADVMFIATETKAVRELARTSATSFTLTKTEFKDGPYLDISDSRGVLTLSARSGTVSATVSGATPFAATDTAGAGGTGDASRLIRFQDQDLAVGITGATQANPCVVTVSSAATFSEGDTVFIIGVTGMTQLNGKTYTIENVNTGANTFELKDIDSTAYTAYAAGGEAFRLRKEWRWAKIVSYTSTSQVSVEIQGDTPVGTVGPFFNYKLGAWSSTTGFPRSIGFFEGRLWFGGTTTQPDTLWASVTEDYTNFTEGTDDDSSITATLASDQVNRIEWISPQRTLRVGTSGSEWSISGGPNSSIKPTSIQAKQETSYGSYPAKAVLADNYTLFLQRTGKKLRRMGYSFEVDGFVAPDISLLAEHLFQSPIKEMAYQKEPDSLVWMANEAGELMSFTYVPAEDVAAFAPHSLGNGQYTVESLAVIPASGEDELWAVLYRETNGTPIRQVGVLAQSGELTSATNARLADMWTYRDGKYSSTLTPSAVTGNITLTASAATFESNWVGRIIRSGTARATITAYTSSTQVSATVTSDFASTSAIAAGSWQSSTDTIESLYHLRGATAEACVDGGSQSTITVSSLGKATLDNQFFEVLIGAGYTQELETMELEGGSYFGSSFANKNRMGEGVLRLYKSSGFEVGSSSAQSREISFRKPSHNIGEGVPLYTGEHTVKLDHKWSDATKFYVRQSKPLPLTLLGITAKIESNE
jgi:hypothetical protein